MSSVEELYERLKEHDFEKRLTLNSDKNKIDFQVNDEYHITVYDNQRETYFEILLGKTQYTHYHPDYEEAYQDLLDYMEGRQVLPTEEQRKQQRRQLKVSAFLAFSWWIVLFGGMFAVYKILDTPYIQWEFKFAFIVGAVMVTVLIMTGLIKLDKICERCISLKK